MNNAMKTISRNSLLNFIEALQEHPDLLIQIRNLLGGGFNFPSELTVKLKKDE